METAPEYQTEIPEQVIAQRDKARQELQPPAEPEQRQESAEPESGETAALDAAAPPSPKTDDWEHKYNVLQGKYNAEVPRLLDEARYWSSRVEQQQAEIDQLKAQLAGGGREKPQSEIPADVADVLGDEAARVVVELLAKQRKEIEERCAPQLQSTAQLSQQSATNLFWSRVLQELPDYPQMQNDPALNAWLNQPWPGQRRSRLEEASEAAKRLDAEAFIGLLKAYAPTATPENGRKPPAPTPRRAAGGGEQPTPPAAMTAEQYAAKSQQIISLRQDGHFQKAADLQKELDAAKREGRVQAKTEPADYG